MVMVKITVNKKLLEKPSLSEFIAHTYLFIFGLFWLLVIVLFSRYMSKPLANEILPVSFSNLEQGNTVVDKGIKYQIIYISDQRFRFPKNENFIYKGGYFKTDKENNRLLIRLFWPDIAPDRIADFLPSINKKSSYTEKYFDTRIWVQIQGEEKAVEFNKETFLKRNPNINLLQYFVKDDFEDGLRVFTDKQNPGRSCSYSLDKNRYVEFCGGFYFYYTPKIRVSIDSPDIKDVHGNPPKWQDLYQGVVAVLDRYHEAENHASH
jgi:hypothetical protein